MKKSIKENFFKKSIGSRTAWVFGIGPSTIPYLLPDCLQNSKEAPAFRRATESFLKIGDDIAIAKLQALEKSTGVIFWIYLHLSGHSPYGADTSGKKTGLWLPKKNQNLDGYQNPQFGVEISSANHGDNRVCQCGLLLLLITGTTDDLSEDCLRLNGLDSRLSDGKKKTSVMLWLHGGGFTNGNFAVEQGRLTMEENFCPKKGDFFFFFLLKRVLFSFFFFFFFFLFIIYIDFD